MLARIRFECMTAIAFASRGGMAASGCEDGTFRLWRLTDDRLEKVLALPLGWGPIVTMRWLPDEQHLALLIRGERAVRLLDLDRLQQLSGVHEATRNAPEGMLDGALCVFRFVACTLRFLRRWCFPLRRG
ncbi:MAG: hypothetical protein AB7Q45_10300 [Planctomycetaceae bacterium]